MLTDILIFLAGLALLVAGGNYLTDGAVAIARRLGISNLMIGLTVVSIGSSMPDLVVCLTSTLTHKSTLAMGDVVGSNIIDVLLVTGVMAVIRPFGIGRTLLRNDLPMLAVSSLALLFCGDDRLFGGAAFNSISRAEGLVFLLFLILFFRSNIEFADNCGVAPPAGVRTRGKDTAQPEDTTARPVAFWLAWIMLLGGLGALVVGGNWVVRGASAIALKAGMSESMVGLTVVAIGGAAPDMAASVAALLKGKSDLAMGNIVGSCILNIFGVLGVCATVAPVHSGNIGNIDFLTLAFGSIALWLISLLTPGHRLKRAVGILLVVCYAGYMAYLIHIN